MSNSELQNEAVAVLMYEQIYNEFVRGRLSGDKNVFERTYAPRLREGSVRNTTAGEKGKRYELGGDLVKQQIQHQQDLGTGCGKKAVYERL